MKVIILRFWQLKVLVFSSDKQLCAAFMAVTVVTVLFTLIRVFCKYLLPCIILATEVLSVLFKLIMVTLRERQCNKLEM